MRNRRRLVQAFSAIGVLLLTGSLTGLTESAWCGFHRGAAETLSAPFDRPHPETTSLKGHRGQVTPRGLSGPSSIRASSSSNPKTKRGAPRSPDSDSARNQALIEAAKTGRVKEVARLLKAGANMQASDKEYGMTPLMWACHSNHPHVVQVLLDRGADVNARHGNPQTPLMKAAREGHLGIVRLLLKRGAEVNAKSNIGDTPLHLAAWKGHLSVAELLLKHGAIVNMKGAQGETPLMVAAMNGHAPVVSLFLKTGADANARNAKGKTALNLASKQGHKEVVRLLSSPGKRDRERALMKAVGQGRSKEVSSLLRSKIGLEFTGKDGNSPLILAARKGHVEIVKLLLDHGANPNARFRCAGPALVSAASDGKAQVVRFLLERGVNVNARDCEQETALMSAARRGHGAVVELLLKKGANLNAVNAGGQNALMLAASTGREDVVRALLKRGADPRSRDKSGKTAIDYASKHRQTRVLDLLEKKVRRKTTKADQSKLSKELLLAVEDQDPVKVKQLLARGANCNTVDKNGVSVLKLAACGQSASIVSQLLKAGARVDSRDKDRGTPLMAAAFYGRLKNIKLLLAKGAKVNAKDINGYSVMDWAVLGRSMGMTREDAISMLNMRGARLNEFADVFKKRKKR